MKFKRNCLLFKNSSNLAPRDTLESLQTAVRIPFERNLKDTSAPTKACALSLGTEGVLLENSKLARAK